MWKHQLPSIFCRNQPTGGFYLSKLQLTSIKLQLDREAPTSLLFQKRNTCWFTLDISSVLFHLLCCSSILISALYHLCIFSDSLSASPSSLLSSSFFSASLLHFCKLQLDREAPTSLLFQKRNTCWFTLDISFVLFHLLCCSSILIPALYHLCIFSDSLSASPSSLLNSSFFSASLLHFCILFTHSLTFLCISMWYYI